MQISPIPTLSDDINDIRTRTANIVAEKIIPNEREIYSKSENSASVRKEIRDQVKKEKFDKWFKTHEHLFLEPETKMQLSKKAIGTDYSREPKDIILLKPVWVNFMKQGEWNPSHSHTGDISCVAYLKIPKEIDEENRSSETSSKSNTPAAGKIEFMYGDHIGYTNTGTIRTPKEKEIFFFPARLLHQVYPFKSKSERISISANFADAISARKNLNGEGARK